MKGALLESYYTGSHKEWADSLINTTTNSIDLYSLTGKYWKWRMHVAAIEFSKKIKNNSYDFIIASDFIDLAVFKGLTPSHINTPCALYMHENQLTYPWKVGKEAKKQERNFHYAFINFTSMIAADQIWFNSNYHKNVWFNQLLQYLKMFPDHRQLDSIELLKEKSCVVPLGLEFSNFENNITPSEIPTIIWNHRWEFDKNPDLFFKTLIALKLEGLKFKLIVLGERTSKFPTIFSKAKAILKNEILHWGFCSSKKEYYQWLKKGDLIPITSNQDFFGISAIEGMACGCVPLLPNRLAFPEHLPEKKQTEWLFDSDLDFESKLRLQIQNFSSENKPSGLFEYLKSKYDWSVVAPLIDQKIIDLQNCK